MIRKITIEVHVNGSVLSIEDCRDGASSSAVYKHEERHNMLKRVEALAQYHTYPSPPEPTIENRHAHAATNLSMANTPK